MNIFVLDDSDIDRKIIVEELQRIIKCHNIDANIKQFSNAGDTWNMIRYEKPDVLLLDIDMPGMNGFDLARLATTNNISINVIFISNKVGMVFESIKFKPYRFIPKSDIHEKLEEAITSIVVKLNCDKQVVKLCNDLTLTPVDIMYIENYKHYILIHLLDGNINQIRGKLVDYVEVLRQYGFIKVNVSIAVNVRYINKITSKNVTLTNGYEAIMSRGKENDIKQAYINARREYVDGIIC